MLRKHEKINKSRREFGEILGVSQDVIANLEYNRLAKPEQKEPLLQLICMKFGVNEEWLRYGEGEMFSYDKETRREFLLAKFDAENDPLKNEFITYMLEIADSDWDIIEKHIKGLVEIYNKTKK